MNYPLLARKYIDRYAPSLARITTYLTRKKCSDIAGVLREVEYDESIMLTLWINTYLAQGSSMRQIRYKLEKKEYAKALIEQALDEQSEIFESWEYYAKYIEKIIADQQRRGKSLLSIESKLRGEYPQFRHEIRDMLRENNDHENLQKLIEKYKKNTDPDNPTDRKKIYDRLMRRGFSYNDIRNLL